LDFYSLYHFHHNHGGSTQAVTDSNSRIVELFVYDESASASKLDLLHHLVVVGLGDLLLVWTQTLEVG
jgi:hypothetical protein